MTRAASGGSGRANLRKVLIAMLADGAGAPPEHLTGADWLEIDRMAQLHRVQPLLHHRHKNHGRIPAEILSGWRDAQRSAAFASLRIATELRATIDVLESAGTTPVALKGAWLAWHAYPSPELRPMRDIDLWLPADEVIAAYELLVAAGYRRVGEQQLTLAQSVALDKHLPPLRSPRGVHVELHHRLWEIDGRMDHAAPVFDGARLRGRVVRLGGITYLDPQDTLTHLIIHAVYDHRLDCGPLLLSDVAFLLQHTAVDWDRFWAEAGEGGWERGAALVLALVRQHAPHLSVPAFPEECAPPADTGAELLLQDLDARQSAGVWATLRAGGIRPFMLRVLASRAGRDESPVARDLAAEGGFINWAGTRLVRTLRELSRRDVRSQSRQLAKLSRWLDQ